MKPVKNIPIILIGFGSIGRRHYANLETLGYRNIAVYDPLLKSWPAGVKRVAKLDARTLAAFKTAFICNPTSEHVETAILCARAGLDLFIEKPLGHTRQGMVKLAELCERQQLVTMVGCNVRFDPALQAIKKLLDKKFLGRVLALHIEYGRYLPYQRPKQDYRTVYAGKRAQGGGVMLDDIHDFDIVFWLNGFSPVMKSQFMTDRISDLDIDVEDICLAQFAFRNRALATVRCDYLQQYKHRSLIVIGEKGNLTWNFRDGEVWYEYYLKGVEKRVKKFSPKRVDPNDMYVAELDYFLRCIASREPTFNEVPRAAETLNSLL